MEDKASTLISYMKKLDKKTDEEIIALVGAKASALAPAGSVNRFTWSEAADMIEAKIVKIREVLNDEGGMTATLALTEIADRLAREYAHLPSETLLLLAGIAIIAIRRCKAKEGQ